MKKLALLILVAASLACFAASSPTVVTTLQRVQTDPQGDNPTATAYFEQKTVVDSQVFVAPWTSVSWALKSDKTVTVGTTTMTYSEVSAFVLAIAEQERTAQAK